MLKSSLIMELIERHKAENGQILDFTEGELSFEAGSDTIHQAITSAAKDKLPLLILDKGYAFGQTESEYQLVTDHINLSNLNPTFSIKPIRFFPISNLYTAPNKSEQAIKGGTVCLNPGQTPSADQQAQFLELGIQSYSYNLVLAGLWCAYYDLSVIGLLRLD